MKKSDNFADKHRDQCRWFWLALPPPQSCCGPASLQVLTAVRQATIRAKGSSELIRRLAQRMA